MKESFSEQLQQIPGVGKSIAQYMREIGVHSIGQLKGQDPDKLYERLCERKASPVDRCVLYIFRCAVYYASSTDHKPELLKWWNWKDKK